MTAESDNLGTDIYGLWRAGRGSVPSVAAEYATANGFVARTDDTMDAAFRRPDRFGGTFGPVYDSWRALRDELQTILGNTADNLELTAEALCLAATEYARSDTDAKAKFDALKRDSGDPVPPEVPKSQYPS